MTTTQHPWTASDAGGSTKVLSLHARIRLCGDLSPPLRVNPNYVAPARVSYLGSGLGEGDSWNS
jgi:hypothetical protein